MATVLVESPATGLVSLFAHKCDGGKEPPANFCGEVFGFLKVTTKHRRVVGSRHVQPLNVTTKQISFSQKLKE